MPTYPPRSPAPGSPSCSTSHRPTGARRSSSWTRRRSACGRPSGRRRPWGVGLGWLPAILLGTITAVGGGAIRDLLLQRVPAVLQDTRWYASVAVLVAAVEVLGIATGFPVAGTVAAITLGVLLRIVAEWRGWTVPRGLEVRPSAVLRRRRRRDGDP
ncbi:trimeric intracellular cation channel family protein [Nonomuraea ferruginea]